MFKFNKASEKYELQLSEIPESITAVELLNPVRCIVCLNVPVFWSIITVQSNCNKDASSRT